MSSLAAVGADGYYRPPPEEGEGGGGRRRRRPGGARGGQGGVRFEMPFPVWCGGCGHLIGKGVRLNAGKKHVGDYFSTKVWEFTFAAPCCQTAMAVRTDPQNTEYVVVQGGRRRATGLDGAAAEGLIVALPDEEQRGRLGDSMSTLERREGRARKAEADAKQLLQIERLQKTALLDYKANKLLRRSNRGRRKEEERLAREGERIGLAGEIKLLPKRAVSERHSRSLYAAQARPTPSTKKRRREIEKASIFAGAAVYGPGAGGRAKR